MFKRSAKKTIKLLNKFLADLESPKGSIATMYEDGLKEAAEYMSNNMPEEFFESRTGALKEGLSRSYYMKWPFEMAVTSGEKLDEFLNKIAPTTKSVFNTRKYPSYWHFLLEGWQGGYEAFAVVRHGSVNFITSPFDPNLKNYNVLYTYRHPGRSARDWFQFFQQDFENIVNRTFDKRWPKIAKKYGLKA